MAVCPRRICFTVFQHGQPFGLVEPSNRQSRPFVSSAERVEKPDDPLFGGYRKRNVSI